MFSSRVDFLGCPIDNLSIPQAVAKMEEFIREGRPQHVIVINANKLWLMERNPSLAEVVRRASLFLPEKAIVVGSYLLGLPVNQHAGGIMVLKAFLPRAEENGYRIYFLGAKPRLIDRMIANLRQIHPRLQIVGWHHGYMSPADSEEVCRDIQRLHPDALFVAMGTPKQEFWIVEHQPQFQVPLCMGVGGSFDVLAGLKRDAPNWVRGLAMEWFYRLVQDPRNLWRRYLTTIPWYLRKVLCARARTLLSRIG